MDTDNSGYYFDSKANQIIIHMKTTGWAIVKSFLITTGSEWVVFVFEERTKEN